MAAVVQTFSQQTPTVTMIQTRPTSATARMPSNQNTNQYSGPQSPRTFSNAVGGTGYRGSSTPVQQYAFTSTPSLNTAPGSQQRHQPNNFRGAPTAQTAQNKTTTPAPAPRSQPTHFNGSQPTFAAVAASAPGKAVPDRYRRQNAPTANHARSQSANLPANVQSQSVETPPAVNMPQSFYGQQQVSSMDDLHLHQQGQDNKGLRRRSMHTIDSTDSFKLYMEKSFQTSAADKEAQTLRVMPSAHARKVSADSVVSSRSSNSRPASSNRNVAVPTNNPSPAGSDETSPAVKADQPKAVNVPPRSSSADVGKRMHSPSPLSKPATTAGESADASGTKMDSPAAKQLAALNQKGAKAKSKTSRLRRAFSFGSAAELRKAGVGIIEEEDKDVSKLNKQPTPEEIYDAEQQRIAEAQEAAGIGSSIYGARFFNGSTDNLSISSTASSASVMIRKMGRGMKKGGRSLAGIFRPKSVIGVPAADPVSTEASQAAVTRVTVEAETQRVNVSAEPKSADGFPHLERNSLDTSKGPEMRHERTSSTATDNSNSRKSIVGGDRERAEVLAAVRKGILKRSGSPSVRNDGSPGLDLPNVPAITDSPNSSAPSTPNEEAQGHRRTSSIALGTEDYFMSALRLRQDTKSAPGTPQAGQKRNATFSPRIIFHDTWPGTEYDRRGDVATCNRLTPMLAQQIKEELNTFKMEMEVHENSKIYTHFF